MPLTDAELIELGKKTVAAREKDKARTKAIAEATKKLIAAHLPEYKGYLEKAGG